MSEAAPQSTATVPAAASSRDDGFAADMSGEDTPLAAQVESESAPAGKSAGNGKFDPEAIDWYRAAPDSLPAELRPVQRHLKSNVAELTRHQQRTAELEREVAELKQQIGNRSTEDRLAQAVERIAPQQDRYADLKSRLDPEEAPAIDVVREIIKREVGDLIPQPDQSVNQQVQQLTQAVQMLGNYIQGMQAQSQMAELREAVDRYGEEPLQAIVPNIRALIQTPNQKTGRNYTVAEAAALFLGNGKAAEDATPKVDRNAAKRRASSPTGVPAGKEGGPLTDQELLSQIAELGFGR